MNQLPLFVFGTLRRGEENHHYLTGRFERWLPATLNGYRRTIAAHGFPAIVPSPGDAVQGELYFLLPDEYADTVRRCDELEDIPPGQTAGEFYRRDQVRVATPEGLSTAWAYLTSHRRSP